MAAEALYRNGIFDRSATMVLKLAKQDYSPAYKLCLDLAKVDEITSTGDSEAKKELLIFALTKCNQNEIVDLAQLLYNI